MAIFQIRDLIALLATLVAAVVVDVIFVVTVGALATWDLSLYGEVFDNPIINRAICSLFFAGNAFIAVMIGAAVSSAGHKKRNSWLFTLVGVVVYAIIFCKFIFIPHRETDDSAVYVLFTSPQIYLYAVGGVLASLCTSYRKHPNSGDQQADSIRK
jgi:hypothetical protein